jgi:hypothetical protein
MKLLIILFYPAFRLILALRAQYSPQHLVRRVPSIYVIPLILQTKFHARTN